MPKKILILDIELLMVLVVGGLKFRSAWRNFGPAHDVASIRPLPQTFPALLAPVAASVQAADWTEIPSHNLFSFDRSDIDIAPVVEAEPPKPLGAKPILFGTMILGAKKYAQVAPGPTGNKNYSSFEVGQEVDGWKIVDIQLTSIIVESNGTRQTVTMNDPVAKVARDSGKTAIATPPSVIQVTQPVRTGSTASTPVQSPATGVVSQPAPASAQPRPVPIQTLFGGTVVSEGAQKQ